MTAQVGFKTKKALKEAALKGADFYIYDPSIFNERRFNASEMKVGEYEVVTNHPKRSWFATIEMTDKGLKVS